jgi:hypothetical protein
MTDEKSSFNDAEGNPLPQRELAWNLAEAAELGQHERYGELEDYFLERPRRTWIDDLRGVAAGWIVGGDITAHGLGAEDVLMAAEREGVTIPEFASDPTLDILDFPRGELNEQHEFVSRPVSDLALFAVRHGKMALDRLSKQPSYARQAIIDAALRRDRETAVEAFLTAPTTAVEKVADLLVIPGKITARDGAPKPIVEGLLLANQTILLSAPPKMGKSYLRSELTRSLIDGIDLYGQRVNAISGRVVIIDLEMHDSAADGYLTRHGLNDRDAVRLAPLQGKPGAFNLLDNRVYAEWCEALTACKRASAHYRHSGRGFRIGRVE